MLTPGYSVHASMLVFLLVVQFVILAIALIATFLSLSTLPIRIGRFRRQIPPAPDWILFLSFTLGYFFKFSFIVSGVVSGAVWLHEGVESEWGWRSESLLDCVLSSTVFVIVRSQFLNHLVLLIPIKCQLLNITFYRNEQFEEKWLQLARAAIKWVVAWLPFSCCVVSLVLVFAYVHRCEASLQLTVRKPLRRISKTMANLPLPGTYSVLGLYALVYLEAQSWLEILAWVAGTY